jgi:hypothetical protein
MLMQSSLMSMGLEVGNIGTIGVAVGPDEISPAVGSVVATLGALVDSIGSSARTGDTVGAPVVETALGDSEGDTD